MLKLSGGAFAALLTLFFVTLPPAVAGTGALVPDWGDKLRTGRNLSQAGRFPEAKRVYLDLLDTLKQAQAPPAAVSQVYDELAVTCKLSGEYDEAERSYLRALELARREEGQSGRAVGLLCSHLGALYVERRQTARAEYYLTTSRDLLTAVPGLPAAYMAALLQNIAALDYQRQAYGAAETGYWQAVRILESSGAENSPQLAVALSDLGHLLAFKGQPEEALVLVQRARAIFQSMPGQYPSNYFVLLVVAGDLQRSLGKMTAAGDNCEEALALGKRVFGDSNPRIIPALKVCSAVYQSLHRKKEAKELARRADLIELANASLPGAAATVDISTLMRK